MLMAMIQTTSRALSITMAEAQGTPDFESALRLFDETVRALEARARRLEEVLTVKQSELSRANQQLAIKVHELNSLSQYLELVLSSVPTGVIAVDPEGRITTANPAARRMCVGLQCALEGSLLRDLFPDTRIHELLSGGTEAVHAERRLPDPHGGQRIFEVVTAHIVGPGGSIVGAVEVLDDVTDVRRLQETVNRGERLRSLGEMAAGVAHEIRNPLNGIEGFASLLARDLPSESRSARHARAIVEGVRDLNHTVTSLLQFTQQRSPQPRPIPLDELLNSVIELVHSELQLGEHEHAEERNRIQAVRGQVTCEITTQWQGRTCCLDGSQIRQALINLIQNALHAAADSPQPRVLVRLEDGPQQQASISISDSGPGVDESLRKEIFTPFFTTKDHGTGLGLAIVHSIVNLHEGSLSIDRCPQLGGARFTVLLPGLRPKGEAPAQR
ncbi:MAG: PAS domain-containing protein [Planctomycetota bacterium]|nr:MAG: PAS domain-containing protein [Planctomycetota bacterium]